MKIIEILAERPTLSFEFFPPKTDAGIASLFRAIGRLKSHAPDFVSVTYGAGGSTKALTEELAVRIKDEEEMLVMAHVTCSAQSREEIHQVLARYEAGGIENVIALRGDPPKGEGVFSARQDGFGHATDLLRHIKGNFNFGRAAACYPEGHSEAPDLRSDIEYVKQKVDRGAEFLITQLFYDNADFYRFRDLARASGVGAPIVAGVLPILSGPQIRRFTALCGASIPREIDERLERLGEDDEAVRELGIEIATGQIADLRENGVEGIHFYALNRSYSIGKILGGLGEIA